MSHYEGKKHAQKVRLYIQMHSEKEERQEHGKQKKADCINFQDGSGVVDKNKYCNLCNMIFTSPVVALSHYLGKIHAKKLKQLSGDQAQMSAQRMQPVSAGLSSTSTSPALQKPSDEKPLLTSKAEESSSSSSTNLELNDPDKYCKLCCAPFNNPLMAHQHYVGKKHRRNEARKKMMEELGDETVPAESNTNAVGVGHYICPICNITLTSIEMYQSHMQGNKHQTRETVAVSLMKNSKKTYDSFQDELADYIKVQKTRGLESKPVFRKTEEEVFQDKDVEGRSDPGEVLPSNFTYEQAQHSSLCSETHSPTNTGEKSSACENTPEKVPDCHYNVECCTEKQAPEVASIRDEDFGLSVAKSNDCRELVSAETAISSYRKEQKLLGKHVEEEKYISEEPKYEKKGTKQKRKENSEDEDSGKESEKQKRMKVDIDLINEKKSKSYKDKRLKENPTEKESKKHKKDKKKPQPDGKTEEELLWDESILGY
ncbi:lysine-rich coiled-coil protein 1 isoform X1 [Apteryx rowi]|uniref:lysine-rich coiled-coil protein 1 isoform X1 n=1 Tax=Apteryx rowi TaxID=308060 RepID=UPI000E1C838A|nr:lysine-rich coiled-coil protein 1 isoform X1 [Apteryx rowi]XP_025920421.1 lysine-rich coiled-coil protein 1 isoform X1 [Apteryx rowi]